MAWFRKKRQKPDLEGAVRAWRPDPGTLVRVVHDSGPPGLEWSTGWLGVEGRVVYSQEADAMGGILVRFSKDAHPVARLFEANGMMAEDVDFIWDPASLEVWKRDKGHE